MAKFANNRTVLLTKRELQSMVNQGYTDEQIGAGFEVTRQAVHQLRKKYGIPARTARNAKRNEKIVREYRNGTNGVRLAKKYGLSTSQTYRIINEAERPKKKRGKK